MLLGGAEAEDEGGRLPSDGGGAGQVELLEAGPSGSVGGDDLEADQERGSADRGR